MSTVDDVTHAILYTEVWKGDALYVDGEHFGLVIPSVVDPGQWLGAARGNVGRYASKTEAMEAVLAYARKSARWQSGRCT